MSVSRAFNFEALTGIIGTRAGASRSITAIVGAPGSGKTSLAERLEARLNEATPGSAAVLPMDGYHFDDNVLVARGLRARKGAPDTFDVGGLLHMLTRLQRNDEDEVAVPIFDRSLEISRAGARLIPRAVRHVIVEGNYLLLEVAPWMALHALFNTTVAVAVPEEVLRGRLTARWKGYGLQPSEAITKVEDNDLPNGRYVVSNSIPAEFTIAN